MRRHVTGVLLAAALCVPSAPAQEPQYFEEPPPRPRFHLEWEALFRYDLIYQLRARPDIERGRFEVRPELSFMPSDRFKLAVRAVGNLGTDDNAENARNFDNYRSDGVTLDRWYVEARPGAWTILAGSFAVPLISSEMLWDRDVPTPGAAVSHQLTTGTSTLTLTAGGFYGPQRESDRTRIVAGQAVWRGGDANHFAIEAAGSYWASISTSCGPTTFDRTPRKPLPAGSGSRAVSGSPTSSFACAFPRCGSP